MAQCSNVSLGQGWRWQWTACSTAPLTLPTVGLVDLRVMGPVFRLISLAKHTHIASERYMSYLHLQILKLVCKNWVIFSSFQPWVICGKVLIFTGTKLNWSWWCVGLFWSIGFNAKVLMQIYGYGCFCNCSTSSQQSRLFWIFSLFYKILVSSKLKVQPTSWSLMLASGHRDLLPCGH